MTTANIQPPKIGQMIGSVMPMGLETDQTANAKPSPPLIARNPALRHFAPNASIYREGDMADRYYKLVSGTVRDSRHISHGRRQVTEFHGSGDIFGFYNGSRISSADAIGPVSLLVCRWHGPHETDMGMHPSTNEILTQLIRHVERLQQHAVLLGRRSAVEKLAIFLSQQASRMGTTDWVLLGMNRLDIADYLGLTVESVSRAFSSLERQDLIEIISAREIKLKNPAALMRFDT